MTETLQHGGRLSDAARDYGIPRDRWLDLSTGINPVPYPVPALPATAWTRLPDPADLTALEQVAQRAYGGAGSIVAAPGTQALIQMLPTVLRPASASIPQPTYGEHLAAWADIPKVGADEAELVVLVNPNNPDGRRRGRDEIEGLLASGATVVVDESFADVAPEVSVAGLNRPGLVVLRSFGKFFGLAGLRLGFAIGDPAIVEALRRRLGPWAVPGPAIVIGQAALADRDWIDAARNRLQADAIRLDALLRRAGAEVIGGTTLFRLVRHGDAAGLHRRLARAGIWVRTFDYAAPWLRFGLPGTAADWDLLAAALDG